MKLPWVPFPLITKVQVVLYSAKVIEDWPSQVTVVATQVPSAIGQAPGPPLELLLLPPWVVVVAVLLLKIVVVVPLLLLAVVLVTVPLLVVVVTVPLLVVVVTVPLLVVVVTVPLLLLPPWFELLVPLLPPPWLELELELLPLPSLELPALEALEPLLLPLPSEVVPVELLVELEAEPVVVPLLLLDPGRQPAATSATRYSPDQPKVLDVMSVLPAQVREPRAKGALLPEGRRCCLLPRRLATGRRG